MPKLRHINGNNNGQTTRKRDKAKKSTVSFRFSVLISFLLAHTKPSFFFRLVFFSVVGSSSRVCYSVALCVSVVCVFFLPLLLSYVGFVEFLLLRIVIRQNTKNFFFRLLWHTQRLWIFGARPPAPPVNKFYTIRPAINVLPYALIKILSFFLCCARETDCGSASTQSSMRRTIEKFLCTQIHNQPSSASSWVTHKKKMYFIYTDTNEERIHQYTWTNFEQHSALLS